MAYLVNAISQANVNTERDRKTAAALAEGKDALIGYAATYASYPGALPCPDVNNDGKSDKSGNNCEAYIGRLPWKDLGMAPIRDGDGECLWYAITDVFRSAISVSSRGVSQPVLNTSTSGTLSIYGSSGVVTQSSIIAVVLSPGAAISGQDRSSSEDTICGGNSNAAAYLDQYGLVNNATGQYNGSGSTSFVSATQTTSFNDKLLKISHSDLFLPVRKVVLATVKGDSSNGLLDYYGDHSRYPYADTNNDGYEDTSATSGILPVSELTFDTTTYKWLTNNQWAMQTSYTASSDAATVTITIDGQQVSLP